MKYKKLSKNQIILALDRLTRFKCTEDKYRRVFSDIIISNLSEPLLKKSEILNMPNSEICKLAVEIVNNSLGDSSDYSINEQLKTYENRVFYNNSSIQELLNNKLNYLSAIEFIPDDTDILNLKWLKSLCVNRDFESQVKYRQKEGIMFPIEKIVIAEGITEEILLPVFANLYGYNFDKNGVKVIAAGGKNQVVKLYYKLVEEVRLPIFILLDKDAESNEYSINTKLREQDYVYLLDSGEFEDLLPKNLIVKTINNEFKNFLKITKTELDTGESMVKTLEELFKYRCLHEFKKADFANRVKSQVKSQDDISEELVEIIEKIKVL